MSAPRTKRQFAGAATDPAQRHITSFFNAASSRSSGVAASSPPASSSPSPSPLLPPTVQSNLLSVGMRVRKSVPEGYKTGSYSAFALWDDNSKPSSSNYAMGPVPPEARARANAFSSPKELLPFCGINSVGGLGTQPSHPVRSGWLSASSGSGVSPTGATCNPMINIDDSALDTYEDDLPGLTSSQESIGSVDSNAPMTSRAARKRYFTEDADDVPEMPNRLTTPAMQFGGDDDLISPRSLVPSGGGWGGNGRIMAIPRNRKPRGSLTTIPHETAAHGASKENVMVVDSDFEEADFLDSSHNWEVEMSDL